MNKEIINVNSDELIQLVKETVQNGKSIRITVVGNSMYPFLRNRIDSAELYTPNEIRKNDVLFYIRPDGRCILHRCVDIKNGEYIMCGDNETEKEHGIGRDNIVAVAKAFYRKNTKITDSTHWYGLYKFLWCDLFALRPFWCLIIKGIRKFKRSIQ